MSTRELEAGIVRLKADLARAREVILKTTAAVPAMQAAVQEKHAELEVARARSRALIEVSGILDETLSPRHVSWDALRGAPPSADSDFGGSGTGPMSAGSPIPPAGDEGGARDALILSFTPSEKQPSTPAEADSELLSRLGSITSLLSSLHTQGMGRGCPSHQRPDVVIASTMRLLEPSDHGGALASKLR